MKRTTSIILCLLSGMILPAIGSMAAAQNAESDAKATAKLSRALTLHASFDKGLDADYARGDKGQSKEIIGTIERLAALIEGTSSDPDADRAISKCWTSAPTL